MTLRFGTDGVRGAANTELTPELALSLGRAAARTLGGGPWLVGRDTRLSGPLLAAAFTAGLASEGASSVDLGVLPTPGVAYLAAADQLPGAVISASHNPFGDNGIKLFAVGGLKLDDATEDRLEAELEALEAEGIPGSPARPGGPLVGSLRAAPDAWERYAHHLEGAVLEGRRLPGLKVVLDCAHGAASVVAPRVLAELGAGVTVLHADPDGTNINDGCGSTHPEALQKAVVARGADVGLAFDGDADRVLAVDASGALVDGDQLIALLALDLQGRGLLRDDTVAVTVMTNLGFRQAMARAGIRVLDTPVGDRHVLAALAEGGLALGGEQSGHIVLRDWATTGDGLLAGLFVLDTMARTGRSLAELAAVMDRLPQVMVNVRLPRRDPDLLDRLALDVSRAEIALAGRGRVLVRPSGTEPVVRVMVEAPTAAEAQAVADELASAARAAASPPTP
ncbi:MAG TPA: phosphoglucosamine mutase [Acidimicrobiales bacterium]|nr:phosphoglucosamine mutase [Acidimicrobiales bacterium]